MYIDLYDELKYKLTNEKKTEGLSHDRRLYSDEYLPNRKQF